MKSASDELREKQEFLKEYELLCKKYQLELVASGAFEGYLFVRELLFQDDVTLPELDDSKGSYLWDR